MVSSSLAVPPSSSSSSLVSSDPSIGRIWEQERIDEPKKKVDKNKYNRLEKKKYKVTRITTKTEVTGRTKSTSRVTENVKGKTYLQATFDDLEAVVMEKNNELYGDAFND